MENEELTVTYDLVWGQLCKTIKKGSEEIINQYKCICAFDASKICNVTCVAFNLSRSDSNKIGRFVCDRLCLDFHYYELESCHNTKAV